MKLTKHIGTISIFLLLTAIQSSAISQETQNPPARSAEFTPERIEKGRIMYKQLCLRCHGPEMVGGNNAFDLRTFPLEDRDRFFNSVTNGKRAMPPWKGILTEEEIGIVWAYVGTRGGKL